ncbi:pyridoxal phosphate-dependent aminotransferase [Streptomyces sp. Je 1-332]|uniref:pyridoxal phosphate-dependent aminotransferase n=1 Tax=Streptomyces sp. Je 1-332 TaxID=3231270 RepID=UPI003458745C
MASRKISPNMALDQLVAERRAGGEDILHLGFGESRLPVFPGLVDRLAQGARRSAYGAVVGDLAVREAVAGYFDRRRLPTRPEQIIVAPGSKPLLMALQMVVPGDLVIPRPAWNTYAPQARAMGKKVFGVDLPDLCGGVPDPKLLRDTVLAARAAGDDPRILILTLPDNPTGTYAPPGLVRELCALARELDLLIVSDEIYRDVLHDPTEPFLSPVEAAPERTVVTTGLSKNLAIGGWRIGAARFPEGTRGDGIRDRVASAASEVWSNLAGPMQEVAAYAFAEPPELTAYIARCTRLHGVVAAAVHRVLVDAGALCRSPTGAFYLYPDLEPKREALARLGITDSVSLQERLLEQSGVAVLGGHHLGDRPETLRFRIATCQLYGDTDELRHAALASDDPLRLPHISQALSRIEESLAKLLHQTRTDVSVLAE